jgi:hypothetical protein
MRAIAAAGALTLPPLMKNTKHGRGPDPPRSAGSIRGRSSGSSPASHVLKTSAQQSEGRRLVPGRHVFDRALKPRIDELARDIGDGRILVRVGVDDRNPMLPQQLDEGGRAEAVVASLDNMPELPTLDLAREDRQGSSEVLLVEALRRRELPQDRPEVFSEFGDAARQGPLDRRTGLGEVRAIGRVTRALESKDEPVRPLARHFRKLADFCVP